MAFCEECDEGVRFDGKSDWETAPDGVGRIYHYTCINDECDNDGGKVWAYATGGVAKEKGVW